MYFSISSLKFERKNSRFVSIVYSSRAKFLSWTNSVHVPSSSSCSATVCLHTFDTLMSPLSVVCLFPMKFAFLQLFWLVVYSFPDFEKVFLFLLDPFPRRPFPIAKFFFPFEFPPGVFNVNFFEFCFLPRRKYLPFSRLYLSKSFGMSIIHIYKRIQTHREESFRLCFIPGIR